MFDAYLSEVDALLASDLGFAEIEDWIDAQPLGDDRKAALWMYAWSEQPRHLRRAMIAPGKPSALTTIG